MTAPPEKTPHADSTASSVPPPQEPPATREVPATQKPPPRRKPQPPAETATQRRAMMQLSSAGFELASFSLLLGAAGYGIDHWLGTAKPYFAIAGVLLGFCLGFYRLIVLASKMN